MENYSTQLNGIFQALADPTRRGILAELGRRATSVTELAKPFDMALPSFMKHIRLLEETGLIRTEKHGRVRSCALEPGRFAVIVGWLEEQRAIWEGRAGRLEAFVMAEQKTAEQKAGAK
jgi:DNA-binding transcriptional ArsR family regulator